MPDELATIFLDHSIRKLEQMSSVIELCLDRLSDDQIWARGTDNENTVGNLVLHLCGNITFHIGHVVAGQPDTRNRCAEFTNRNVVATELKAMLKSSVATTTNNLRNLPKKNLIIQTTTMDGDQTILEVIYQVVGHFQQHTGQIIFATKQLTGEDLMIYKPPTA